MERLTLREAREWIQGREKWINDDRKEIEMMTSFVELLKKGDRGIRNPEVCERLREEFERAIKTKEETIARLRRIMNLGNKI